MGSVCHRFMCILLYMKCIQCSGVAYICGQLEEGGTSALGICTFIYMQNLFGVVVLHRSMVDYRRGVHLPWVYVHSSICETYLV